jgi:hypothetical protein
MVQPLKGAVIEMMKQWFRRGLLLPAAAICALSVPVTGAHAALVTYAFAGNIDGISDMLVPVTGSFQFDKSTGGSGGAYSGAVTELSITLGGAFGDHTSSFNSLTHTNGITISPNLGVGGGFVDRWELVSGVSGPGFPGSPNFKPYLFDLRLDGPGGALFSDTTLQDPPSLSVVNGEVGRWRLYFETAGGFPAVVLGSITNLTAVPLPAAVLLFGAGLISLVGLGAGGLRNLRGAKA